MLKLGLMYVLHTALLDSVRVRQAGEKGSGYALREVATVGVRDGSLMVSCFDAEVSSACCG